jgi:mannan endo-1,4-beta-mannosidase
MMHNHPGPLRFVDKRKRVFFFIIIISIVGLASPAFAQTAFKSLNYLYSISGSKTASGEHNREPNSNPAQYTNQIFSTTGKYPALWSGDFLFASSDISSRQTMINQAKSQWASGALINIMFHACPPTQGEPCAWSGGVVSSLTNAQWTELITSGTTLNNNWKARLDVIAVYLQDLKNNGVEVFFRPFHEMNQGVFWWAGRSGANGTRKLFQITRDYLVGTKGLTNLIWVWDLQDFSSLSSDLTNYDPGSGYWDVLAMDMYSSDGQGYTSAKYNAMVSKAGSKPIAIGECQVLPTSSLLSSQPRWTFFMGWSELVFSNNSTSAIQSLYGAANVVTRDEMPGWSISGGGGGGTTTVPTNLATNRPVTVSSTEAGANIASYAVDNSYTTRWASAYADPQWITVDLGANYNVNRVKITWEAAYARNYSIQYSTDNSTWTTARSISNNTTLTNDNTGLTGTARYVRIYGTTRATTYGYSIFALEVYGTASSGGGGGTTSNLALNKSVTTTSNENTTNTGPKAVDANGTTRWSSAYADNQNLTVDLGANYNVNRVRIAWEAAYARDYQIQFSTNNSTWTTIRSVTGKASSTADDYTGLTGQARWVRVNCITRATAYGFSFFELEVYGTAAARLATKEILNSDEHDLISAFPNPAEGKTTIVVSLPRAGHTFINLTGSLGNHLREIHNGVLDAGKHEFVVNTENLASGLVTYSIVYEGIRRSKKILIK